jgi:hypothetical protein
MLRGGDVVGPYTLVREIGCGSFGIVWHAERRGTLATARSVPFFLCTHPT